MTQVGSKIRILHIIKSLGRGGAEMLLPETLKLHDQVKFEFHCIYFLPWKDQMVEAIQRNGGKVTCFKSSNNIQIIMHWRRIIQYIKLHNIQLVHCHLPWAGMVGRLVYKALHAPVIYTEHNKQERYHIATRLMNKLTFDWQSHVIAVSSDVAMSIRSNIRTKVPVQIILNGVNTIYFQRSVEDSKNIRIQVGIPEQAFIVGTIAVFRFQKRLLEWLEVFAAVSKKNPQLYGIIVGDGSLRNEIVQHSKVLGLEGKIFMPGLQTDVKPWLSAMDVFMMTSLFEGLPIALLEAMSMECAIVTTDAGGMKEVIRHGQDGLMLPVDSWQGLTEYLERLMNDEVLRKQMAKSARMRVMESFGMEKMVRELEVLYVDALSDSTLQQSV